MDQKSGIKAAFDLALARAGERAEAEQLPLLPPGADQADQAGADGNEPRGRGRPPGAKNKSTEAMAEYLLTRHSSPLEGMARLAGANLYELAAEFGATSPEFDQLYRLAKLQLEASVALAPYLHSKQPVAIDAGEHGLVSLTLMVSEGTAQALMPGDGARDVTVEVIELESVENQGVSGKDKPELDKHQLDKPQKNEADQ